MISKKKKWFQRRNNHEKRNQTGKDTEAGEDRQY